mgnify:CR=1 FL=1
MKSADAISECEIIESANSPSTSILPNGVIHSPSLKTETSENQWGSLNYQKTTEGKTFVSYNFDGAYKSDYVDYAESLVASVLEQIKK